VTLVSPTRNKIINDRMGYPLFDCGLSAAAMVIAAALGEGGQRLAHSTSNFSVRVPIL